MDIPLPHQKIHNELVKAYASKTNDGKDKKFGPSALHHPMARNKHPENANQIIQSKAAQKSH